MQLDISCLIQSESEELPKVQGELVSGQLLVSSQKGKAVLFVELDDFSTDRHFPGSGNTGQKMMSVTVT